GEAEYKESLRHILVEAERTTLLIEQLLSLARADSGRETLQMQPVDLSKMLRDVVESWQQMAAIRGLHFASTIPEDDLVVMADDTVLRRLADILLDNAFKYTPASGAVRLSLEKRGESAVMKVKDTGPGIAEGEQRKIFQRFYRIDKAHSRAQGGAGLG